MMGIAIALAIGAARIPPVDQCTRDRPFVQFRSELRRTVAKRDAEALLKVVADDVYASFGGYIGKKDFIELWKLGRNPRQSHVWQELGKALELGCAVDGDAESCLRSKCRLAATATRSKRGSPFPEQS